MFRKVNTIHQDEDAGKLMDIFSRGEVGIAVDDNGDVKGILTKMDLFDHLTAAGPR
jgi:predicted transcriptional regulator